MEQIKGNRQQFRWQKDIFFFERKSYLRLPARLKETLPSGVAIGMIAA